MMEFNEVWKYDDFPDFTDEIEGVKRIPTTGKEVKVQYIHGVEYANVDGVSLHLQILIPITREELASEKLRTHPCVVYVQGSAWMEQDVYGSLPAIAKLAERGYVIAVVEYRHSGIAAFPAQIIDAKNAVRFMRAHAEEFQVKPDEIILAGNSSGGHTTMYAALIHNDDSEDNLFPGVSAEVKGLINYYGSCSVMREDSNPSTPNHHLPDSPEGMVMGNVNLREHPELCEKLSVECNITEETKMPPTLIFHGTKDRIVNVKTSVDLYNRMKQCGKDVEFYLIDGADHGGAEFWMPQVVEIADGFIRRCLSGNAQ